MVKNYNKMYHSNKIVTLMINYSVNDDEVQMNAVRL